MPESGLLDEGDHVEEGFFDVLVGHSSSESVREWLDLGLIYNGEFIINESKLNTR